MSIAAEREAEEAEREALAQEMAAELVLDDDSSASDSDDDDDDDGSDDGADAEEGDDWYSVCFADELGALRRARGSQEKRPAWSSSPARRTAPQLLRLPLAPRSHAPPPRTARLERGCDTARRVH
jgi:hypothetical protein